MELLKNEDLLHIGTGATKKQPTVTLTNIETWQLDALVDILNEMYELRKQLAREGEKWVPVSEAIITRIKREILLERLKAVIEPEKRIKMQPLEG